MPASLNIKFANLRARDFVVCHTQDKTSCGEGKRGGRGCEREREEGNKKCGEREKGMGSGGGGGGEEGGRGKRRQEEAERGKRGRFPTKHSNISITCP